MKVDILPLHLQDALGKQRSLNALSRAELSLCLDVIARIIHSNDRVEIIRPEENKLFPIEIIQSFRKKQYERISSYLNSSSQANIEKQLRLDERSYHFVAVKDDEIIAAIRVTPPPYECSFLLPELSQMGELFDSHYWEMGRLVVDSKVNSAFVGEKLLYGAARWLCHKTDVNGFLLLCKKRRRKYFEYYGLKCIDETTFCIPQRENNEYYMMFGNFPMLIDNIFSTLYRQPEEIEKRYRWNGNKS